MIVIRRGRARPATYRSRDIDDVVRSLVSGQYSTRAVERQVWRPALDVFSTDTSFEVVAELAGMDGDDIDVVIEGDILAIRGVRTRPTADDPRSYYEARIPYGPFAVEVLIPFEIDWNVTTADFRNGLLRVSLPRPAARTVPVRQIEVTRREEGENDDA